MRDSLDDYFDALNPTRQNIVIDADFDNVDPVTKEYATGLLDYAYNTYGYNAPITSGYRDPERNANAGGAPNSWHMQGKAVDFDLSGLTPEQVSDIEAKAREKFGEVLYHDAGSGLHLHAANPIQSESVWDKVASVFTPAVAEASPAPTQQDPLDAYFGETVPVQTKQVSPVVADPLDAYLGNTPAPTPTQPTDPELDPYSIEDKGIGQSFNGFIEALKSPIETLSVLNKPTSALAGAWKEIQNQTGLNPADIMNPVGAVMSDRYKGVSDIDLVKIGKATADGWDKNDKSFGDLVDKPLVDKLTTAISKSSINANALDMLNPANILVKNDWSKVAKGAQEGWNNPTASPIAYMALGLVLDAAGDPLQAATPAKVMKGSAAILKKIGATDKLADIGRIVAESKGGKVTMETLDKVLNFEVAGIPLKRWFQEDGLLGKEEADRARLEAALNRRVVDQVADVDNLKAELIKSGVDPKVAEDFVGRAVQARPTIESTMTPDEIVKAYRDKTLNAAIIEGKVDMQDAIDALIAEKNAPAHRVFRAETKAKIDEIKLTSENTINNLRRDMTAEGKSIAEINDAVKAVKESSRAEIANVRALDRVQAIVEASRTGKGTYIADEFLTPQQKKEVAALRKDKAEALAELRESIDPYGLTIDELPDRIAFREARKPIDEIANPKMDAALRNDDRIVPEWVSAVDGDGKPLFKQDILDLIRQQPKILSKLVDEGKILPQQVVDAVNKAKDAPTLTDIRLAQKKADIQQIVDTQNMAIAELDALKADKKITEEAYKTRIKATKEATKEAIADLALDVKIREIVNKPVVPRVPRGWLDDARQEQLKEIGQEAAARKKQFASEVDPYGISIDEKTPKQQILEENRRINAETRKTIDDVMTSKGVSREQVLGELDGMGVSPELATKVRLTVQDTSSLMDEMARLGYQAGMLTDKDMIRFFGGSHLFRPYGKFENFDEWYKALQAVGTPEELKAAVSAKQVADSKISSGKRLGLNLDVLTERVPLSKETREKMGQITNSEYLLGKTGQTSVPLFTQAKFFDDVKARFAVTKEIGEGNPAYLPIEKSVPDKAGRMNFGSLAGMYVPKEIYPDVMIAAGKFANNPNGYQKAVSWWKIGKLLNPATYMRNIQSGAVMANVFGGIPSVDMPKYMKTAFEEMRNRGSLYKEARDAGMFRGSITNAELNGIIGQSNLAEKGLNKLMGIYGKSDDYWRMAVYTFQRQSGKSIDDAVKIANRALFDYGKVPPLLDKLRRYGVVPFGAFPYFAAKETGRALYNNPAAVTKYLRAQWKNDGTEEKRVMPEYQKGHTLMRLGQGTRTVKGEPQEITSFLDMTYLLPFANDVSFGPLGGLYESLVMGKDYLGRDLTPPMATNTEIAMDRGAAAIGQLAPTMLSKSYWEKPYRAATGTTDDKGRAYSAKEAAAQNLLGWKTVNVNIPEERRNRLIGLDISIQKASSDLNRLKQSANPDESAIKQREEHIRSMIKEIRKIQQ